tara:strand:- start:13872 stop:14387 length:516 start_codon:yes stop_codon:yes gene_type:complete
MDEVSFIIELLSDNWSAAASTLQTRGDITNTHIETPRFIDVRSIAPNEGRRIDMDSQSAIVVFEDSSSTEYPTIDYAVRNETFTFTLHLRVLHRRDFTEVTFSRDRLQALYRIARYIIEDNALRPTVNAGTSTEESAELIKLTARSEANDRGKKLLGYKISVEMKRFGRNT